ncbi:twin-arginine translocase subunit TatC [bacterium]|nr:twin-arginine translocase subunit TatC [bacterium]
MTLKNPKEKKTTNRKEMPFLDHLEELRWRILKSLISIVLCTFVASPFTASMLRLLTLPNDHLKQPAKLIFLKPTGMFMIRMEVAVAGGIIISFPIIFYQFWQFVAPGLLSKEKKYFLPTLFFTTFCFLAGALFCYTVLIPVILPFLFSMGTETIEATININEYMSFVLRLIVASGLIFELPILSYYLSRIGIITPTFLRKYRRHSIVFIFIFAAIITPPDPFSQTLLAIPLLLLYEISIWVSMIGYRKKKVSDKAFEEEYRSPTENKKIEA